MDIKRKFGSEIKQTRKDLKLSQEELAHQASLNVHTLSDIERGKTDPKLTTVLSITSILDIDLNQFQDEEKRSRLDERDDDLSKDKI